MDIPSHDIAYDLEGILHEVITLLHVICINVVFHVVTSVVNKGERRVISTAHTT